MAQRWWHIVVGAALLLGLSAASAASSGKKRYEAETDRLKLMMIEGQWKRVELAASELIQEITSKVKQRDGELDLLAEVLADKAIAEANLGQEEEALWHWQIAQAFDPQVLQMNLEPFARAQTLLAGKGPDYLPAAIREVGPSRGEGEEYEPVQVVEAIPPVFPRKLSKKYPEGSVVVEVVVDQEGQLYRPRVEDAGPVPKMAVTALEVLRSWRLEPARRGGTRLAVEYTLRLRYR